MTTEFESLESMPHWDISIRPNVFDNRRIPNKKACSDIIAETKVRWRGWDYPHIGRTQAGTNYIQSDTNALKSVGHIESWRLYQSAHFIHRIGFIEDARIDPAKGRAIHSELGFEEADADGPLLSINGALYLVTEVFEFASRLIKKSVITDRIVIEIKLFGVMNRTLFFWDPMRTLFDAYTCKIDTALPPIIDMDAQDFFAVHHAKALDTTIEIFEQFNWFDVPRSVLETDQLKFIEQRS